MRTEFVDSADGTRLRVARWGEGQRDLLVVHGLAEHAGRYGHVAAALVARGWRVTFVELRGHGHSGGKRGHVARWADYLADVQAVAATLTPGFAMVAHSMGGLVSLEAVRQGLAPRALALSNPLTGIKVEAPIAKIAAAHVLSRVWPSLSLYNELRPEWLSRDPTVGAAYDQDELVYRTITPRWYTEMASTMARVQQASYSLPLAFFVGDDDVITDPVINKELAHRSKAFLKVYPGFRHEIFNEIGKEQVLTDLGDWLERTCGNG